MNRRAEALIEKFESKKVVVGIVGLGYVGLPLALTFAEAGFRVIGFDTDERKCEAIAEGESYLRHVPSARLAATSALFTAKCEFSLVKDCDAVIVCVPTPMGTHREPDLSYVRSTVDVVAANARAGQLIVLESTTYPGTTREEVLTRLADAGLDPGCDVFVAFSPEREDPGNPQFDTHSIPKLVGGTDPDSGKVAAALYAQALKTVVPVRSAEVAEAAKILENVFRSVNIALVNELKIVLDRMGIDVWEVIEAAKTKPFGFMPFYPGSGYGGHCIPIDPFYLTWKAAEYGCWTRFIELAGEINTSMPRYVVDKVQDGLNSHGKSVMNSRVLVLGLAYKPNVDDDRESPSFEVIELLREKGAYVQYCDPLIPTARPTRKHDIRMVSVPTTRETFAAYDAVVLCTAHDAFTDQNLYRDCRLVIDTRNVVRPGTPFPHVVKA